MISCDYNSTDAGPHSTLLAVLFDGRGLYGRYEGGGQKPSNLDACGGHVGFVPAVNLSTNAKKG